MYALIVKDNGGYNPFGYNIWLQFSQTNNDELQKVEIKAVFSTPSVRLNGYKENEKTVQAMFFSSYDFAVKETVRINKILAENEQEQYEFIIVSAQKPGEMITDYK